MIKKATNNWGWKLLSLFLAFLLWVAVVNTEDPQVSTTIRGIPVEKQNENSITSQKRAIKYVEGDTVDVKVKGKRSIVYKLTQSNIKAFADMRNLSITNAADIQLELPNEIELISKSPSSVLVSLEKIITKQMEIQYEKHGKAKAGFVDLSPTITPSIIELEAAESTIYKIEKVVVPVNIEGISGDFTISVIPILYDYSGSEVSGVNLSATQVQVKVPVEKTKTLPINFKPKETVKEGFVYIGAALSDANVMVRGKQSLVDKLQELVIDTVDIGEMTEKQTVTVNLAKLLPDGVSLNQDNSTVDVNLQIEPMIEREFSYRPEEIQIKDLPEEKEVTIISELPATIHVKGIESKINALTKNDINPTITVADRNNGTHAVTVEWELPEGVEAISPNAQVTIEIISKPESREAGEGEASETNSNN